MSRGEAYRFLLRMPQELRDRLVDAAQSNGSSLNREIVHRLEASLEKPVSVRRRKGEEVATLKRRRWLVALALVVLGAAAVAASGAMQSHPAFDALKPAKLNPHALPKSGDPDAQTRISANSKNLGGPDSYAAEQLANLAYPSNSLNASTLAGERSTFAGVAGRDRVFKNSSWSLSGPQTATQPAVLNFFDFQAADFGVSGRVTALAVDPGCNASTCRLWLAAAGGGIWRTDNALASSPTWTFLSGGFGTNAIGALTYDASSHTLYAGTGEPNASGDSESGVGIYASTDGGDTWSLLPGSATTMTARSISSIVPDPNHPGTLYVGTARGVRGVSAVTGGAVSLAPDAAPWGLWKTTDGGKHFSFIWDGHASLRGINHVEIDPTHNTLYAAAFQQGIWRSTDGGSTWEQVFATQDAGDNAARTEFALNWTPDGHTRIYVGDGGRETDTAFPPHANTGVYRGDAIDTMTSAQLTDGTANPGFASLTDPSRGRAAPTYDYCDGQCWYDNLVVSPAGHPDMVYIGGSFDYNLYGFLFNSGRAVLLSQDAGAHWTDQTRDIDFSTGIHPDQHALVVDPANPLLFFEGSDGGIVHSSGQLTRGADANCPPGTSAFGVTCHELLSQVPTHITEINAGLSTLQFQGIAAHGSTVIGGTQDNGTWLGTAGDPSWDQTIYGDGGVAAFDATDHSYMMNEFFGVATDGNFENGAPDKWVILSGPLANSGEGSEFYKPQIGDPVVSGTFFVGLQSIWRTQDFGGDKTYLETNCPEFTVSFAQAGCGDFVALGSPSDLGSTSYGSDRSGGVIAQIARTPANHSTLWVGTSTGRVFISQNADNATASAVTFTRLDNTSSAAPQRFPSGLVVDSTNPNRAWITYTGYNENTPSTPGHVFEVVYNPSTHTATWNSLEPGNGNGKGGALGDLPATAIARDPSTGTVYVGTDFGVLANTANGAGKITGVWKPAAPGMPQVEVTDLEIDQATHTLYAATHGRAIWQLPLH
ncbi:MAG: Arc family DNA-binding protein [Gaiellaceae bacterium]